MADLDILRSQANEVLAMLQEAGIDSSQFHWEDRQSRYANRGTVSTLVHAPTSYYFKFDYSDKGKHFAEFSPGPELPVEEQYPGNWANQRGYVVQWVQALKRELEEPDLWGSVLGETALIGRVEATADQEDAGLSAEEQARIAASLTEIREYIFTSFQLSEEQQQIVSSRLAYLEAASSRVGRKDWIILATGTLMNIAVSAALNPSAAREVFRFTGQALGWLLAQPLLLP
jgi:hypothetical protein